jgi:hypothetical protein
MPQGSFADRQRARSSNRGQRPPSFGLQQPPADEQFVKDEWQTQPIDRALAASPEVAALMMQLVPGGQFPASLMRLLPALAAGATEGGREVLSGEDVDPAKMLTRAAFNTVPQGVAKAAPAMAAGGRALTKQALARGAASSMGEDVAENLAKGQAGMGAEADVTRMASAAEREGGVSLKSKPGAKGPTGLPDITPADSQRFVQYAKEMRRANQLGGGARQAYLRVRPETADALKRAGGDFDKAAEEFEALANTLGRVKEGAARQGFNWPRFLAGAGVGGMVDYATGIPGLGTGVGTTLGALEASIPLRLQTGQAMTKIGTNPYAEDVLEAVTRTGAAGTAAATAGPQRRKLKKRD